MKLTFGQLHSQDDFWGDDYYVYAIHKTDGGAVYLYRMELGDYLKTSPLESFDVEVFRLDGTNLGRFCKHIKKWIGWVPLFLYPKKITKKKLNNLAIFIWHIAHKVLKLC